MKKSTLFVLGTLAAVAAALPATVGAHGGKTPMTVAMAMKSPLVIHGSARLTIVHGSDGCHSWFSGKGATATGVKAVLAPGQRLTIVNKDLDMHKLLSLSGPKLALGKALSMNDGVTLTFKRPGIYKLRTMPVDTPGMPEVETMGPDHVLAMLVVVR